MGMDGGCVDTPVLAGYSRPETSIYYRSYELPVFALHLALLCFGGIRPPLRKPDEWLKVRLEEVQLPPLFER